MLVLLTANDSIVTLLSPTYPPHEVAAVRAAIALPFGLGGVLMVMRRRSPIPTCR